MPTNFDHNPKLATRGQQVRLKSFGHPDGPRSTWSGTEPEAWQRVGNVRHSPSTFSRVNSQNTSPKIHEKNTLNFYLKMVKTKEGGKLEINYE